MDILNHLKLCFISKVNCRIDRGRVTPSTTTLKRADIHGEIIRMNIRGKWAELAKLRSSATSTEADDYFEQLKRTWEITEKRK
jgi:hypothetical protein